MGGARRGRPLWGTECREQPSADRAGGDDVIRCSGRGFPRSTASGGFDPIQEAVRPSPEGLCRSRAPAMLQAHPHRLYPPGLSCQQEPPCSGCLEGEGCLETKPQAPALSPSSPHWTPDQQQGDWGDRKL
ncbi:hypothetical protein KIL84_008866 [Mauremys mutica]|uniref:Uncharacterized protein n=1 Tax=Mauremys mutica TaxID=74926 RepID=A0A9D3X9C0_9SAUR|nr:hypothetical protein KIL84_008866 [Mauremys mutica]